MTNMTPKTPADVRRYSIPQNTLYLGPVPTPKAMRREKQITVRKGSKAPRATNAS